MDVLELTWRTVIPLLIVIAAAMTTVNRLIAKYEDRRTLNANRHRYDPSRFADLELTVNAGIEREWVRIAKHVVCIFAVTLMIAAPLIPSLSAIRNWLFVLISVGLMLNSIRDAAFDRRATERYRREDGA